jgi:bifunctional DNase/RNase
VKKATVFSLIMVREAGQYLLTLEEADGMRLLPIWIGPAEGMSIAAALGKQSFPRPLTHDLFISVLKEMEVKVEKIIITDLKNDTFYANIILRRNGKSYVIDSRPSDSIAIALRTEAPIFIEEDVLAKCPEIRKPITEEEVDRFRKDIENMKPEDFFREKKDG